MDKQQAKHNESTEKNKKTTPATKIKFLIVFSVLAYSIVMMANQQFILNEQYQKQQELLQQKEALEADKDYYTNELEYIGSDSYIIKEAKERLGWLFEGETKYILNE